MFTTWQISFLTQLTRRARRNEETVCLSLMSTAFIVFSDQCQLRAMSFN